MRLVRSIALGGTLVLASVIAAAHNPLKDNLGRTLRWANPANVGIVINSDGSDDLAAGEHIPALRMSIEEWNAATGTTVTLVEDTTPAQQARTDWEQLNIHLILFDESNDSGYFPSGSGIVAVTPLLFSDGVILDADILFNGDGFNFSTEPMPLPTGFDVADVAAHELGHLVGLDHSAWASATMYPFVDDSVILHRSLSSDEVHGLRASYPSGASGRISGRIRRLADASPVAGANVVARDTDGRPRASILTDAGGNFLITGLDPGDYEVYAVPLGDGSGTGSDAPVDAGNLGGLQFIDTDFRAAEYSGTTTITGTENVFLGNLDVDSDIALNLGTEFTRYPIQVVAGQSTVVVVDGNALASGSPTLELSDPDLSLGAVNWSGTGRMVTFSVTVPAGEAPGHVDLTVRKASGAMSILPAALEITPASPTVSGIVPGGGSDSGGTTVAITGTGFGPGARVVIGDQLYTDGVGGTSVVDPTTITLTTQSTLVGTHDVVVVDASGVEGRLSNAFYVQSIPRISTIFPPSGSNLGQTPVTLTGTNFVSGGTVRINGVDQNNVDVESPTLLTFTTTTNGPAPLGPQVLEVENPGGGIANFAFSFAAQADPVFASVAPASGLSTGGETIVVSGSNFTAQTQVLFGADEVTGTGGVAAAAVTFLDANTLEIETPVFTELGVQSMLVREPSSGQASVAASAFTVASAGGGGGGGGCYTVPVDGPRDPEAALLGCWWILAVLLAAGFRARQAASTELAA